MLTYLYLPINFKIHKNMIKFFVFLIEFFVISDACCSKWWFRYAIGNFFASSTTVRVLNDRRLSPDCSTFSLGQRDCLLVTDSETSSE